MYPHLGSGTNDAGTLYLHRLRANIDTNVDDDIDDDTIHRWGYHALRAYSFANSYRRRDDLRVTVRSLLAIMNYNLVK